MVNLTQQAINEVQLLTWIFIVVFSLWGGMVRYLMDLRSGKKRWSWKQASWQMIISGFTGCLGGLYSYAQGNNEIMTLFITGVCSTMGGRLLRWLWRLLARRGENKA